MRGAPEASGATLAGAAPMSGPYALEAFGDAIFFGNVNLGSTVFLRRCSATATKRPTGDIYAAPSDLYSPTYVNGIETLLPSDTPLDMIFAKRFAAQQTALFDSGAPVVTGPRKSRAVGGMGGAVVGSGRSRVPVSADCQNPLVCRRIRFALLDQQYLPGEFFFECGNEFFQSDSRAPAGRCRSPPRRGPSRSARRP